VGKFGGQWHLLIAWVGLRGAVPIVLATFPLALGMEQAGEMFVNVCDRQHPGGDVPPGARLYPGTRRPLAQFV